MFRLGSVSGHGFPRTVTRTREGENGISHKVVNGEIHMPNHPLGYIVMKVPVKPRE